MDTDPRTAIVDVFKQVLENYGFMFSDALDEGDDSNSAGPFLQVEMSFKGLFEGRLLLAAPVLFAEQLAVNVLGLDSDEPQNENETADAIKELLNITCGNLLTVLAGENPVFDLTIPEVTTISDEDWQAISSASGSLGFMVEDWPVFLQIAIPEGQEHTE